MLMSVIFTLYFIFSKCSRSTGFSLAILVSFSSTSLTWKCKETIRYGHLSKINTWGVISVKYWRQAALITWKVQHSGSSSENIGDNLKPRSIKENRSFSVTYNSLTSLIKTYGDQVRLNRPSNMSKTLTFICNSLFSLRVHFDLKHADEMSGLPVIKFVENHVTQLVTSNSISLSTSSGIFALNCVKKNVGCGKRNCRIQWLLL